MKIDRLLGITIYLLNRNTVNARELADKFEVSLRTIQRDIDALNLAGIPVLSLSGVHGGYKIVDNFKLEKQITNTQDFLYILTALKGLSSGYESQKLQNIIEKVNLSSPKNTEEKQKLFLDLKVLHEGKNTDSKVKLLEKAIDENKAVSFNYTNAENNTNHRIVEPIALTYKWYSWYLLGYCTHKHDYRMFKLVRIDDPEETRLSFTKMHPPAERLLSQMEKEDLRSYYDIKLLCCKKVKKQVSEYLNGKITHEYKNGDFIFEMHMPKSERMWFSILLGFGNEITVLEPEELKSRIKEKAIEIVSLYID